MTKDRTSQLQTKCGVNKSNKNVSTSLEIEDDETNEETSLTGSKIPKIIRSKSRTKTNLDTVFAHVNEIISLIERIKEDVVMLKKYHVSIQHSSRLDQNARDENHNLNEGIKTTSAIVADKIKALESKKHGDPNNAISRVINTQKSLLIKMHRDAIDEYENALSGHRKHCENIIKKELLIVIEKLNRRVPYFAADVQVSDEDLLAILDSEDTAVFVDNYMKETAEARELLQDVRDRHKEVLALEKDVTLIRDMFLELGINVAQQGELIDRIEYHIGVGLINTTKGNKKLNKARTTVNKIRKKKLCIIICLCTVIGILVLYFTLQRLISC